MSTTFFHAHTNQIVAHKRSLGRDNGTEIKFFMTRAIFNNIKHDMLVIAESDPLNPITFCEFVMSHTESKWIFETPVFG